VATTLWLIGQGGELFPEQGEQATNLPKATNNVASGSSAEGRLSLFLNGSANKEDRSVDLTATTALQSTFFGRFTSRELAAQTIPAQTWTAAFFMGEEASTANQYLWPVLYVWRPGVGRVGFLYDPTAASGTELPTTPAIASKTFSGTSLVVQTGDVLVLEVWYAGTSGGAAGQTQTLRVTSNPDTKLTSPYTIQFKPNPKIETLKEDFEAPLDTSKWLTDTVNGSVVFSGGTGNFSYTAAVNGNHAGLESQGEYDFAGSSAFVKIADAPWWGAGNPAGGEFSFSIESANTNRIDWTIYSTGNLSLIKFTNNTWGQIAEIEANFRPVKDNYAWLRFRESGGTIYFEAAPLTASNPPLPDEWVVKFSGTVGSLPITLASAKVTFRVWISNATAGIANPMPKIDALNGPTTSGPTSLATLTVTEGADTVASDVAVTTPPRTATLTVTEAADTISGAAKVATTANLTRTESADTIASIAKGGSEAAVIVAEAPDTIAATASVIPFPLIETFTENFEAPLDTAKWNPVTVNGTIDFVGGVGVQTLTSAAVANQASLISKGFYTFLGSSLFYKFVQPIRTAGNVVGLENGFGVRTPDNGRTIQWWLEADGVLKAVKQDQFVQTVFAIVEPNYYANPLPYTWLRIRESAGTVYFDSAPDTASNPPIEADWVNRASAATATINGPWTQAQVNSYIYMQGAAAGVPTQPLKIDGINTAANAAVTSLGNLAVQEAADAISSTVTVEALATSTADLSVTEAPDTVASTVTVAAIPPATANLTLTEAPNTISATAGSVAGATFTRSEAPDTIVATASSGITANLTRTEAPDAISATASSPSTANLGVAEAPNTLAASVSSPATGALTSTEAPDTISATALVLPFPVINASLTVQEAPDQVASAAGSPAAIADFFRTEAPDTIVASATATIGATLTRTEAPDGLAASAAGIAGATLARTEAADSLASSATVPATGNLSKQELDDSLSSIVKVAGLANLSIQEAGDTLASTASVLEGSTGGLTVTEAPDTLAATGTVADPISFANLSVTEAPDTSFMYTVHAKKRAILIT
jgi:hypothetical protein